MSSNYIQSVTRDAQIKSGDHNRVLRELKADIEQRLRESGAELKTGISLREKFFASRAVHD